MENIKLSDQALYAMAEKKAREIRSFYYNLMAYCIVIPILIAVNLTYNPQFYWFIFSMVGWGTGLLLHGMTAFSRNPFGGKRWEERKLAAFIEKERKRQLAMEAKPVGDDQQMSDSLRYERARKQVEAISGFFKHFTAYLLVNLFLLALKYYQLDPGEKFVSFETFSTAFFWGFGLAAHAVAVFGQNLFLSREWEERKIRELMKKRSVNRWE